MISLINIIDLIDLDKSILINRFDKKESLGFRFSNPTPNEIIEIEKKFGVSYAAHFLLSIYAGLSSTSLNTYLLEQNKIGGFNIIQNRFAIYLNESLDELLSLNNTVVWRWLTGSECGGFEFLKKNKEKFIKMPHFLSTSTFKKKGNKQYFEIKTSSKSKGKFIADIVERLAEREVLFKTDLILKITGYDDNTIYMEELDDSKPDIVLHKDYWLRKK
jgi:ADP-ribosyltransferase exoenzyme